MTNETCPTVQAWEDAGSPHPYATFRAGYEAANMPSDADTARDMIWQLRAALIYQKLTKIPWAQALDCASALLESGCRKDGIRAVDAVREDLTYWTE
ncbi:hypothetical protein [Candidimonas nitroreducens]|uniref:hypothetical protein n=1 Tax=Candidimonas nitroreducens TaxID=683354 RepID=UPI0011773DBE|nr:hypothetical protein [Candidimonas nitroreducens]